MSDETIPVNADALYQLLQALTGPAHLMRELQVTRNIPGDNPINTLVREYNAYVTATSKGGT